MSDNAPASSGALADQASEQPASAPPGRAAEQPALVTLLLAALALLLLLLLATPPTQIVVAWMLPLAVVASLALPRLQQLVDQGHGRQLTRAALTYGTLALAVLYAAQATELVNDRPSSGEEPFINVQSKQREDQGPGEEPSAVLEPATITTPQPAYPIPAADLVTPQPHADAPVSVVTAQPTAFHSTFLPLIGVIVEPPPSGLTFLSQPRISRQQFARVLERGTDLGPSPAAPHADELYDIIAGYGIDPAVALAFFAHESQYGNDGVTKDQDTKNWGNLRSAVDPNRIAGFAETRNGRYVRYASWQDGLRDWCELMLHRYVARGLDTVEKAIPVYAPSWDGNVPARYIWAIKQLISTWQRRDPAPTGVGAGE